MTQRETVQAIRALGLSVSVCEGEYRVALKLASSAECEMSAYYTFHRDDALATARAMVAGRTRNPAISEGR